MKAFTIRCNPPRSTAQSSKRVGVKKNGIPFSYTTAKGKQQEADFASLLMPYVPEEPLEGPLALTIIYKFPFLKSEKRAVKDKGWTWHFTKPDADNLVKMFQDCMGKLLFYNSDAQVVDLQIQKIRSQNAGIYIWLREVEDEAIRD